MRTSFAVIGIVISSANFIYYIYTVDRGSTRPHVYSWLIWGLVTAIAYAAQAQNGGGDGAWITLLVTFFCFIRAIVGLNKGEKAVTRSDRICLGFCLLAIVLWQLIDDPLLSVIIVTIINVAGMYPTVRKSIAKPEQENASSFFLFGVVYALSIASLSNYEAVNLLYPAVITATSWGFAAFLLIRRSQLRRSF